MDIDPKKLPDFTKIDFNISGIKKDFPKVKGINPNLFAKIENPAHIIGKKQIEKQEELLNFLKSVTIEQSKISKKK